MCEQDLPKGSVHEFFFFYISIQIKCRTNPEIVLNDQWLPSFHEHWKITIELGFKVTWNCGSVGDYHACFNSLFP